jgi:hypothetical protein
LTDRTYDKLLVKLAAKQFEGVTPELRENILKFYASMKTPDPHGIDAQLAALKTLNLPATPRAPSPPPAAVSSAVPLL